MGLFDSLTDWVSNLFSGGTSSTPSWGDTIGDAWLNSGSKKNDTKSSDSGGGWLTNLLPSLTTGGLSALGAYQASKNTDSLNDKNLALAQQKLAQEKELAMMQLAQAGAAAAENAAIMKKKILVDALTAAARGAIDVGNNQATTSLNVGQMLQNPLMRK